MTAVVTIAIRPNSKKTLSSIDSKQEELNAVLVEFEELIASTHHTVWYPQ